MVLKVREYKGRLNCSDDEYRALQMARQHLASAKVWKRELERDAEELRKIGLYEKAMKYEEAARKLVKDIRYWESEVEELERKCFGKAG